MKFSQSISEKKQSLLDKASEAEFVVGETVTIPNKLISTFDIDKDKKTNVTIIKVNKVTLIVKQVNYPRAEPNTINKSDVIERFYRKIGGNPFNERFDSVRSVAFQLSSIIHALDLSKDRREEDIYMSDIEIQELNWNPYVFNKNGEKEYFQRDFCWTLKDKQLLIESIYNKVDCGKILVRLHGWHKLEELAMRGETELAFKDIIDGKQRMKTIQEFIFNEFTDLQGNYYNDLSEYSQFRFGEHQLFSYSEMPESTTDEEVIYQFLKMNFTGVPQSQEHLDFVKEIGNKL